LYVVRAKLTLRIMSPPPCHGGMRSSSSSRPYSAPTPVGANILWPENT
jgi:hypothetical protein